MADAHQHAVLVVEDDADNLEAVVTYLDAAGFAVEATTSAEAALHRLRGGFRPCGLVVDVVMPGLGGWGLVETIRYSA